MVFESAQGNDWKTQLDTAKTHRHLGLDNVLHLDMQVLYFQLHALSSFHCSCAGELWLLQLLETGGKIRTQVWGERQTLVGQYQRSILDRQGTEGASALFMLWDQRSKTVFVVECLRFKLCYALNCYDWVAYLIFELGDLSLAGSVALQVVQHNLSISQKDFGSLQVSLQPLLCLHIPVAHLWMTKHLSTLLQNLQQLSNLKSSFFPIKKKWRHCSIAHTLHRSDRDQRQSGGGTWSWAVSSLDSSSLLSRNTFCLSSYSSSSCTSICFSCRTHVRGVRMHKQMISDKQSQT